MNTDCLNETEFHQLHTYNFHIKFYDRSIGRMRSEIWEGCSKEEVIDAFNNNDENYYNKLYYLYDRFIDNISKEDFEQKYNSAKPAGIIGKFYSLSLIEKLEDNKPEPTNEIVDDILRYAFSSTRDSSKFIKIS